MITIIHGDDVPSSRNTYLELKKRAPSLTLDGVLLDTSTLTQSLRGDGLFEENKTVFIEQLLSKRKKSKELEELIRIIQTSEKDIILWEGKELERKTLSLFPNASVKIYKLPQVLFSFLDALKPRGGIQLVKLFHDSLVNVEPEMLFSMITRQVRLLLAVSSTARIPIDEVKRLAPWQEQKLKKQASLFSENQLQSAYAELFTMDHEQKTGKAPLTLPQTIDIWLLKL